MNNKKSLMISLMTIVGVLCILVGSIAYYRITVSGSIKGSTGNAVFNVTGFTNESTKEIVLKEGKLIPGDKGSFTLSLDATNSEVDMYVTLTIDRGTLPTNLKFYTTSDYKSELHKYYEFMDTTNQSKDITVYWYWNPYIDDEEDSSFINNNDVTATIKLDAVQISEYAMMKNGARMSLDSSGNPVFNGTEFWNESYISYIRTIKFDNDLSNLPETCDESNLCWDVSYDSSQTKKVYAYLIDSGLDYTDSDSVTNNLYNLYIVSEAPIFAPSDCSNMFAGFSNLISIDFNNNFNTSNVTNMQYMFMFSTSLAILDLNSFNTSNVTNMRSIFNKCSSLTSINLNSFNTLNVTSMRCMFQLCGSLTSLDLSNFNTSNVTDMSAMFMRCASLTSLDLSCFNTSKVTTMENMFRGAEVTILDLSSFNTSNVTNMSAMFLHCPSLISLNLGNFNTSNVTNMYMMFTECYLLESLDLSSFNTSNVTNMELIFNNCRSLTSLNLSSFNTSKVTNMDGMFYNCRSLTSLDLSSFNTTNVTNMSSMFGSCSSLTSLDLSSFDTSKTYYTWKMFYNCQQLTTTINIMRTSINTYTDMFNGAATAEGACITVNYIADASSLVDTLIATKSSNSNVVKGNQI